MNGFQQMLPLVKFTELAQVLEQFAGDCAAAAGGARALTSTQLHLPADSETRFCLAVLPGFSVLLRANPPAAADPHPANPTQSQLIQLQLTFDREAISQFLKQLRQQAPEQLELLAPFQAAHRHPPKAPPQVAQALLQRLTLALMTALTTGVTADSTAATVPSPLATPGNSPTPLACQPLVAAALVQQVEQERLLNQVTTQIRQSLELPQILNTAVTQVRELLQVDRLLIMEFTEPFTGQLTSPEAETDPSDITGRITYEALATDELASILESATDCWVSAAEQEPYRTGHSLAIDDIEQATGLKSCTLELLRRYRVRACLATPILVQENLWGLLIAQECDRPRQWQEREETFLRHIAAHLGIAIQQAQLYAQLQQQKQTLEERVGERTQALQAALLSTQSANRAKSDFLATMSHELRTPLTCVIGMSATLLRWSLGPLNEKQRSYLKTIHDSGEHLLELINDILDMSQVEAGKAVLNLSEFSLSQLARQSLQVMRDKAQTTGIELRSEILIPPHRDRFTADQRRLRQILFNLLSNAIKFTPAGGTVTLRVWTESQSVVLQVEDTGIGIPASQQPLLFQKFQQLDSSYQRSYEGLGLGLALTKQLVDLHRGWIRVESVESRGSIFTVELPRQRLAAGDLSVGDADAAGHLSPGTQDAKGRIVLIEDREDASTLICEMLTAAGYQVVWMVEPSTAVEQIQYLQPLAVITSLNLPSMDGYEIIRRLRLHPPTQEIKILLLIEPMTSEERHHYLNAGADAYLSYPIDPQHLLYKIKTLLSVPLEAQVDS